jgi:ribonuclease P protein component
MSAEADRARIPDENAANVRDAGEPRRFVFRRRHRLTHAREFDAVFAARLRKSAGPLTVFLNPTDHPEPRLGLSIGRRVGNAVTRNRLKRHIREAFRLLRSEWPTPEAGVPGKRSFDVVVTARAHAPLAASAYQSLLDDAVRRAAREHARRVEKRSRTAPEPGADRR